MGAPLYDITIYYSGKALKGTAYDSEFNYITDFYHNKLNGYKPPKTGRITIDLKPNEKMDKPFYVGAICCYGNMIDELKYLALSKKERYQYILDLLHGAVFELAELYHWDRSIFNNAYDQIIEGDFRFKKTYPKKNSPDRKRSGQIVLEKTEHKSVIYILITGFGQEKRKILLEKKNWFWYDSAYKLAKICKWFDNNSFGLYKGEQNCYYSLQNDEVVNDLIFDDNNF